MKRKYHGWIYREQEDGYRDQFFIHITRDGKPPLTLSMGYGAVGAAAAVAYFEESSVTVEFAGSTKHNGLNLDYVMLELTPLGMRVYTEVEDSPSPAAGDNQ